MLGSKHIKTDKKKQYYLEYLSRYGFSAYPVFYCPSITYENPYKRKGGSQPSNRDSIPRSATKIIFKLTTIKIFKGIEILFPIPLYNHKKINGLKT